MADLVKAEYVDMDVITAKDYDALGKPHILSAPTPTTADYNQWSVQQKIVMLKQGQWSKSSRDHILFAIAYANRNNADIFQGDVYSTGEGRLAFSDKFKIRRALETGNIVGIQAEFTELDGEAPAGCVLENDIECTVTIYVKGWKVPIIRRGRLSRWFKPKSGPWKEIPEHMLELRVKAKACEDVPGAAMGTDEDEYVPEPEVEQSSVLKQLKTEIEEGQDQ